MSRVDHRVLALRVRHWRYTVSAIYCQYTRYPVRYSDLYMAPSILAVYAQHQAYWNALHMSHPRRRNRPLSCPCRSCRCSSPSINMFSYSKHDRYPCIIDYNSTGMYDTQYIGDIYPVPSIPVRSVYVPPEKKEPSIEFSVSTMPVFIAAHQHAFVLQARPVLNYTYYHKTCTIPSTLAVSPVPSTPLRYVHASPRKTEQSTESSVSIITRAVAVDQHAFVLPARSVPKYTPLDNTTYQVLQ